MTFSRWQRWLGAIFVAILLLFLCACLIAWHWHWRSVLATIAAIKPRPGVVLPGPSPDPSLLREYDALMDGKNPFERDFAYGSFTDRATTAWMSGGPGAVAPRVAASLVANTERMQHLHTLLTRGIHWGHDLTLEPGKLVSLESPRMDIRAIAVNLRLHARTDSDPRPELEDLTAWRASLLPPTCLAAFFCAEDIAAERDQAFLTAAILGRLPVDLGKNWQEQPEDEITHLITAIEMQRCFWEPAQSTYIANLTPFAYDMRFRFILDQTFSDSVEYWWHNLSEMQMREHALDEAEGYLLAGGPPMAPWTIPNGEYTQINGYRDLPSAVLRRTTEHRLAVLAAQVIKHHDQDGSLPLDGAGLDLAAGKHRLLLAYHRIDDQRFAIIVDPATPYPDYAEAKSVGPYGGYGPPSDPELATGTPELTHAMVLVDLRVRK